MTLCIQSIELNKRQENFPTYLHGVRVIRATETEWNGANGADVGCHIIAHLSIATCDGTG